jgi:hypothetical protein
LRYSFASPFDYLLGHGHVGEFTAGYGTEEESSSGGYVEETADEGGSEVEAGVYQVAGCG